jgi:hypothetical protein
MRSVKHEVKVGISETVGNAVGSVAVGDYDEIGGIALVMRVEGPRVGDEQLRRTAALVDETIRSSPSLDGVLAVSRGWFAWTRRDARETLRCAMDLWDRFTQQVPTFEADLGSRWKLRWGIWVDRYILPGDNAGVPVLTEVALARIFDFEPDGLVFFSEGMFRQNRRWEQFVRVPIRRRERLSEYAYKALGRKRPSALDHLRAPHVTNYVGRSDDLAQLDVQWNRRSSGSHRVAIVGPPGAGKTRLVGEWRARHPEARAAGATFSVFGGDLASFVEQLVELPDEPADTPTLVECVCARIVRERIDVLVLDDLHWVTDDATGFLQHLLESLPSCGMLVLLCARPSGEAMLRKLAPDVELRLPPLASVDVAALSTSFGLDAATADYLERYAYGNPLFVEQLSAWVHETRYTGEGPCPETLRDVVAARIEYLRSARLQELQQRALLGTATWRRGEIERELAEVEADVGRWLDRLETGDYAERADVLAFLTTLQSIDRALFVMASLFGMEARSRANRIDEAIERLLLGNGRTLLENMRTRRCASAAERLELFRQAQRAGVCAFENAALELAEDFFTVALSVASEDEFARLEHQLAQCRRRLDPAAIRLDAAAADAIVAQLAMDPAVDPLNSPEVWLALAVRTGSPVYYERAARAAEAVGDRAIATLAIAVR